VRGQWEWSGSKERTSDGTCGVFGIVTLAVLPFRPFPYRCYVYDSAYYTQYHDAAHEKPHIDEYAVQTFSILQIIETPI
jgi:hypothetical protein